MRLRYFIYAQLLLVLALVISCVTEFQPGSVSIPTSLIVEGQITDQPGPYSVKLTKTADYSYKSLNLLETGATVTISDNLGNQEVLKEQSPGGVYVTSANGIQGVAGRSYKLTIKTKAGKQYESDAEVLQAAPPILKLYYEYTVETGGLNFAKNQGWNVYLDTKDPEVLGNYYKWDWQNYEFTAVCSQRELPNGTLTGLGCCSNCWNITRCYNCISLSSDANINGQAISRQLIMRVPYKSTSKYYLEVQQQAISKGAYQFWKSVKGLVSNTGGLFDAAPSSVQGNLHCVNDPATLVYGYFGATGVSEQYINVDRSGGQGTPDADPIPIVPQPSACVVCENSLYRTPNKPRWWQF
ncbi:DUF4249 domain-containing protein [Spirosoma sp. KCTC 42546]|uniref:DUF4249 domain-containing protein n=1 Tax=Spirosoma sp. KCTC 42546 TaxID=2520506 RepID=UPI00115A086E|nr:DUF4249 domain-containing protein [Spirosoma sp. KCTC 42546]QDK80565.1 DUF4249 domain-containing protein [Spirosoma sp. KCTC 42546]